MTTRELTAARARELFDYDARTGLLHRKLKRNGLELGVAGTRRTDGYLAVSADDRRYKAHRVIWLWMTGEWPKGDIDHLDGNRTNNVWTNLRDVPRRINTQNQRRATRRNKCGFLGVATVGSGFVAQIQVDRKHHYIGYFPTPELAHAAYLRAKARLHEGSTLGFHEPEVTRRESVHEGPIQAQKEECHG